MIDTIPQDVLLDYQSRTINDAKSLIYANAEHTMLDALVLFEELLPLGYVPFTAHEVGDTEHEAQLWQWAHEGKYGPIAEYVPPPVQMPVLTLEQRVTSLEAEMAALKGATA